MPTVGSLFSGIGGLDLGLEWAGFETKWFCEIEKFPQAVLREHWPDTPIIEDVRDVTAGNVQRVDVIAGGFPCQDISWAGKGRGIDYDLSEQEGTRSGLWWEMWRVIRDLRPRYVIAENVPALTHRGLDIVLGSLAEIGYDAEWQTISAAAVGAPHIRERVFIVAYRNNGGQEVGRSVDAGCRDSAGSGDIRRVMLRISEKQAGPFVAHDDVEWMQHGLDGVSQKRSGEASPAGEVDLGDNSQPDWFGGSTGQPWPVSFKVGDTASGGLQEPVAGCGQATENGAEARVRGADRERFKKATGGDGHKWVETEYDFRGMAYGVSDRVGALKGYGNAVVPQVGYLVGRAVREHAEENGWY